MTKEYPLDKALMLQEHAVHTLRLELIRHEELFAAAERELEGAQKAHAEHRQETQTLLEKHQKSAKSPTAWALQQFQLYLGRRTLEEEELRTQIQKRKDTRQRAQHELEQIREKLALAQAEQVGLENHRENWQTARNRKDESNHEQALEDSLPQHRKHSH